ncbi:MAG: methyltransferase domain-containing protein [Rhodospirillum sp.]|nr:methyltransferase domain-containing protein [Rhodospirillum sp.]MCF8491412.1 methyltransferase domain-containing protein [Rhodospirillum sp.]MCF8501301.1 methyltransferase domain-containing protein [Rhodospirillum sp.]
MSGFDGPWLALREPLDRAARDGALVADVARHLVRVTDPRVLDIGCGTGSTWRSLSESLPGTVEWLLLDHDPLLLTEARRRIGGNRAVVVREHDLNDITGLPLEGVALVTASALFDLCSRSFCAALVARLAETACGLYAALTYDGVMGWSRTHPLDGAVVEAFNRHQRRDKGLGPALGPDATEGLAELLRERGFDPRIGSSPWRMDHRSAALQAAFLGGFRQPLSEIGTLSAGEIEEWLSFRLSVIDAPDSRCLVGHSDLLAFPPRERTSSPKLSASPRKQD